MILKITDEKELVVTPNTVEDLMAGLHINLIPELLDDIKKLQPVDIAFHIMRFPTDLINSETKELIDLKQDTELCTSIIAKTLKYQPNEIVLLSDIISFVCDYCRETQHTNIYWYMIYILESNAIAIRFATI